MRGVVGSLLAFGNKADVESEILNSSEVRNTGGLSILPSNEIYILSGVSPDHTKRREAFVEFVKGPIAFFLLGIPREEPLLRRFAFATLVTLAKMERVAQTVVYQADFNINYKQASQKALGLRKEITSRIDDTKWAIKKEREKDHGPSLPLVNWTTNQAHHLINKYADALLAEIEEACSNKTPILIPQHVVRRDIISANNRDEKVELSPNHPLRACLRMLLQDLGVGADILTKVPDKMTVATRLLASLKFKISVIHFRSCEADFPDR